jgi:hypothetical protein
VVQRKPDILGEHTTSIFWTKSKLSKKPEEGSEKFGMKSIFQACIYKYALFSKFEIQDFQKQQINSTYFFILWNSSFMLWYMMELLSVRQ